MALVQVDNLTKVFRTFKRKEGMIGAVRDLFHREYLPVTAVNNISFSIEPGECVGYIGANGAGKSTTIKMLTGILVPTSGNITVNGYVPHRDRKEYTRSIGVVFGQRTQLWWDIAVIESFKLLRRIYAVPEADYRQRLDRFVEILDIGSLLNTPVRKLSLGQRMRCDLVASLLHNPPILFLDEPTIGIDVLGKIAIREFLEQVNKSFGATVILTTHDLDEIQKICSRVVVIDKGAIIYDGPIGGLQRNGRRTKRVTFDLAETVDAGSLPLPEDEHIQWERAGDHRLVATFDRNRVSAPQVIEAVWKRYTVSDVSIEEESIEEIVRGIYQSGGIDAP